jgi:hypothetical protein
MNSSKVCENSDNSAVARQHSVGVPQSDGCVDADQYNLPAMASFTDAPLLCEEYAAERNATFTAVNCPYPSSQHLFTESTWEANVESLRCNSNNNTLCAAGGTPLTQTLHATVGQLLFHMRVASALQQEATNVASCAFATDAAQAVLSNECEGNALRAPLMGAWISISIAAACSLLLAPMLLMVHRRTAPFGIATVEAIYNPGEPSAPPASARTQPGCSRAAKDGQAALCCDGCDRGNWCQWMQVLTSH